VITDAFVRRLHELLGDDLVGVYRQEELKLQA
jgi:hypothetical protein